MAADAFAYRVSTSQGKREQAREHPELQVGGNTIIDSRPDSRIGRVPVYGNGGQATRHRGTEYAVQAVCFPGHTG